MVRVSLPDVNSQQRCATIKQQYQSDTAANLEGDGMCWEILIWWSRRLTKTLVVDSQQGIMIFLEKYARLYPSPNRLELMETEALMETEIKQIDRLNEN